MNKRIIIPTLALSTLLAIGLTANSVGAENSDTGRTSIIQRLSERFNVEESEVEAVFDAHRDERHEYMSEEMDERLSQAVSAGTITEEQKQALIAKREQMHEQKKELMSLDASERHEAMEAHHEEFKIWAEENGINPKELGGFHEGTKERFKRGFHHMY